MGLLRIFFALAIAIHHVGGIFGYQLVTNQLAVLSFFIISGFYMALILDKKYVGKNSSYELFITNRFLRIYPLYWFILILTFSFVLIKFTLNGNSDSFISHYLSYYSNFPFSIFFLETINFILRNLTLILNFDYVFPTSQYPGYLLVSQAWTLQVELLFYLLVPFLWKPNRKLFYLFIFFHIVLFYGVINRFHLLNTLSLTYVFLYHFLYFLLGMVSHKFYKKISKIKVPVFLPRVLFFSFVIYLFAYNLFPFPTQFSLPQLENISFFLLLCLLIPFFFLLTKNSLLDKILGELSYPIYISHVFFVKLVHNVFHSQFNGILAITLTIVASILFVEFFQQPIDRIRQDRLK